MKYYMVSLGDVGVIDFEGLKVSFNGLKDWVKFHHSQYMILTSRPVGDVYEMIRKHIDPKNTVFIIEANIGNRRGYIPKILADWLAKDHGTMSGD